MKDHRAEKRLCITWNLLEGRGIYKINKWKFFFKKT